VPGRGGKAVIRPGRLNPLERQDRPAQPARVKFLLPLILGLAISASAAEASRDWTDVKGRKITGKLVGKDDKSAEILLKTGKRAKVPLASLSEEDQKYIEAADVHPDPELTAKTLAVESNEANTKLDKRAVEVTLSKIHGRKYSVTIHWLGPVKNGVGIYKSEVKEVSEDGKLKFEVTYDHRTTAGTDYKGYVVGLGEDGEFGRQWVGKAASQKPFERFLEEKKDEE
jgi:hypothetical protein